MILGTSAFVYVFRETAATGYNTRYNELPDADDISKIIVSGKFHDEYIRYCNLYNSYLNSKKGFEEVMVDKKISEEEWKPHKNFIKLIENENSLANKKGNFIFNKDSFQPIRIDLTHLANPSSNDVKISSLMTDKKYKEFQDALFINEHGLEIKNNLINASREVEKMSKSKYNVVNPDEICEEYGADSLRLFEMFLGPLEQAKPWNTAGISGVFSFLKKLWKLYIDDNGLKVTDAAPTKDNLKTLHKTIKKVEEDIENFSFNTSVSTFMICVNELTAQKCSSREILTPLTILISPYAPHIAEELWERLGNTSSIAKAEFPTFDAKHLIESSKEYPVSFNGKTRFKIELSLDLSKEEIEKIILEDERTKTQLEGRTPKKVIVVPGKIINIVG